MSDTQWTPKQRDHVHQFVLDKVLRSIIEGTTEAVFDQAGWFTYTDEIAAGLNARWREARYSDVV